MLRLALGEYELWRIRVDALEPPPECRPDESAPASSFWAGLPTSVRALTFYSMPVDGPLERLTALPGALRYVPAQFDRWRTDLGGSFDEYLQSRGSKVRGALLRQIRRFQSDLGGLDFREYRRPQEMAEFHALGRQVSEHSWQQQQLDRGLPAGPRFRDQMIAAAAESRARGYVLMAADQPAAFVYCTVAGAVLNYELPGYDQTFAKHSPGTVLLYCMLRRLMEQHELDWLDFGPGCERYKRTYGTHCQRCADVHYLRPTAGNRLLVAVHAADMRLNAGLGMLLDKAHLRQPLKTLMRISLRPLRRLRHRV